MAATAERVLVWGAGGHGSVVADLIRACGCDLVGYVDSAPEKMGAVAEPGGARVIVGEAELRRCLEGGRRLPGGATVVLPAIGSNRARCDALVLLGDRVPRPLVHPTAAVSPSAEIGPGTVVFATAVVNAGASIGRVGIINTGAVVEHDCQLMEGAHVSPGAILAGRVRVGSRSWIGAGAVVIEGVRIGGDAIVGAGAVVIREVGEGDTVVGNPARPIRRGPE